MIIKQRIKQSLILFRNNILSLWETSDAKAKFLLTLIAQRLICVHLRIKKYTWFQIKSVSFTYPWETIQGWVANLSVILSIEMQISAKSALQLYFKRDGSFLV